MIDAIVITEHGKYIIKYPAIPPIEGEIHMKRFHRLGWLEGAQRQWNHRRKPKKPRSNNGEELS